VDVPNAEDDYMGFHALLCATAPCRNRGGGRHVGMPPVCHERAHRTTCGSDCRDPVLHLPPRCMAIRTARKWKAAVMPPLECTVPCYPGGTVCESNGEDISVSVSVSLPLSLSLSLARSLTHSLRPKAFRASRFTFRASCTYVALKSSTSRLARLSTTTN